MDQRIDQLETLEAEKAPTPEGESPAPGGIADLLVMLQGTAGNEAVTALLEELGLDGAAGDALGGGDIAPAGGDAGPPGRAENAAMAAPPPVSAPPLPNPPDGSSPAGGGSEPGSANGVSKSGPAPATGATKSGPAPATGATKTAPAPAPATGATKAGPGAGGGTDPDSAVAIPNVAPPAPGAGPTLTDPSSGVDWETVWGEFNSPDVLSPANLTRTVLEAGRLVPGWGLLSGVAADVLGAVQEFSNLPDDAPAELEAILAFRSVLAIQNNALGHISYVNQLIQDALAGSVVGAEFVPITMAINEAVGIAKVSVGGVQFLLDVVLEASALYQRQNSPPGSDSWKAYDTMASNFAANLMGDVLGLTLDVVGLASAGLANDGPIRTGAQATKAAFPVVKTVGTMILQYAQGLFNVYGGSAVNEVGGVEALADPLGLQRMAAFAIIRSELTGARRAYDVGDVLLDLVGESIDAHVEGFRALAMEFTDGEDPFIMMRDAAVEGLNDMRTKVASAHEMGAMATTGAEKAAEIHGMADDASAAIDSLVMPDVTLPEVELGDGMLADAGEFLLNSAAAAANLVIEQAMASVDVALDRAKGLAEDAMDEVRAHADEAGEFLQILTDVANEQVTALEERIGSLSDKLAQCESGEQFIELLVNQALELAGMDADFRVDDLRNLWADVGQALSDAEEWAIEQERQATQDSAFGGILGSGPAAAGGAPPGGPTGSPPPT